VFQRIAGEQRDDLVGSRRYGASGVTSMPASLIWPELGRMSPLIWLNKVVLPAPFGPMIRRRSPGRIASEMFWVTTRPPNAFFRLTISSA